ncbi:MAG: lysophospholipid acyltransferase family protein [Candidatus Cloacimonetes bacterium]|nr:lysophospholipid acyltransferase family protein [Candidatus Cloacimonadota bacterium]MDY0366970.1 lysophospholipid acyltransferase family protein [Candidatus Syntrophosphaera sp.]
MPEFLFQLEAVLGAWLLRLWRFTLRIKAQNQPPNGHPCVYALQHRDLLLLAIQRIDCGIAVMVSRSRDGEFIARPLARLGFLPVRGSTSRSGSQALKELVELARKRSLAITPDGPKGPAGSIQPGILQLALLAQIPIIPVVASAGRQWQLNSWDRFRIPKPFSKLTASYGPEIRVRSREDFPAAETALRQAWEKLT